MAEQLNRDRFREYERDLQALEGVRFRREADELIALAYSTYNSPKRTKLVANYLADLVGDETAAADAERERYAQSETGECPETGTVECDCETETSGDREDI